MKFATNLTNLPAVLKKVDEKDVRAQFPGMTVESGNGCYTVKTFAEVVRLSCPTAKMQLELTLPDRLLPGLDAEHLWWPFTKADLDLLLLRPYDPEFTKRIAMSVIHKEHAKYGIVPGSYHFTTGDTLHVRIEYDPMAADAVILFSAEPYVMSYANTHRRTAFSFGNSGIYAVILPFNYMVELGKIFPGSSEWKLRETMTNQLILYLKRLGYHRFIEVAG